VQVGPAYGSGGSALEQRLLFLAQSCWQAVPKQLKVVWRPRPEGYPDWSGSAPEETPSRIFSPPVTLAPPQTRLSTFVGRG
jgi:hypothetical protein